MADSPTTRNRLRKQEVGAKTNAWGGDWNEDGGSDRLDEAMDGVTGFALSGLKTLTSTNYEADEARMRVINVTSGSGGTITIPAVEKWYLVRNGATGDVVIANGSNSVTVVSGEITAVFTNGTTIYSANAKKYVDAAILAASLSASLPSQSGNAGKFVTTDGTTASWGLAIALQTGQAGKYLTTDGTNSSWTALSSGNITTALGFTPVNKAGDTIAGTMTFQAATVGATPAAGASGYASFNLPHGAAPTTNLANGDLWTTTAGFFGRVNGATIGPLAHLGANTFTGLQTTVASATGSAGFNLPHGAAPTSPVNGDVWTTSAGGLFVRINGATQTLAQLGANTFTGVQTGTTPAAGASGFASFRLPHGSAPTTNLTNGDLWTTTGGLFARINGATIQFPTLGANSFTGLQTTAASTTGGAGFNLPHGAAPTSPVNGDVWTTTSGFFARINGATAPLLSGTVGVANGGLGITTTPSNGTIPIGNGTNYVNAAITQGSGITVTNGSGSITLATNVPQAISSGAASSFYIGGGTGSTSFGAQSVVIGQNACPGLDGSCTGNVVIGYGAGLTGSTKTNCTVIGANSPVLATGNVWIGTGAGTMRFQHDGTDAYVSHNTTASAANAYLDSGTSKLQRSTSSLRYKRDIEPLEPKFADALLALEPIFYRSKILTDRQDWSHYGFSAEQMAEIDPRFVQWGYADEDLEVVDGHPQPKEGAVVIPDGLAYDRLTVPIFSIVKRQAETIADQAVVISSLADRLATLEAKLGM